MPNQGEEFSAIDDCGYHRPRACNGVFKNGHAARPEPVCAFVCLSASCSTCAGLKTHKRSDVVGAMYLRHAFVAQDPRDTWARNHGGDLRLPRHIRRKPCGTRWRAQLSTLALISSLTLHHRDTVKVCAMWSSRVQLQGYRSQGSSGVRIRIASHQEIAMAGGPGRVAAAQ